LTIDWDLVLAGMMGDELLLRDCIEACLVETPRFIESIHAAVAICDSDALKRAAHSLKGSIAFLHMYPAIHYAQQLESNAASGDDGSLRQDAATLDKHFQRITVALNEFLQRERAG
jgi:HPt (histidine-containing phosphotransfer) domain-containing protein